MNNIGLDQLLNSPLINNERKWYEAKDPYTAIPSHITDMGPVGAGIDLEAGCSIHTPGFLRHKTFRKDIDDHGSRSLDSDLDDLPSRY